MAAAKEDKGDKKRGRSEKIEDTEDDAGMGEGVFHESIENDGSASTVAGGMTATPSPSETPSSAGGMPSGELSTIVQMLQAQASTMQQQAAMGEARHIERQRYELETAKESFETKMSQNRIMKDISDDVAGVAKGLSNVQSEVNAMKLRLSAVEQGHVQPSKAGGKGKPQVMRVHLSPRGEDPWTKEGADPWEKGAGKGTKNERAGIGAEDAWNSWQTTGGKAPEASTSAARTLEARVGARKTIIVGGFPSETGRPEIEGALRNIVAGTEGVEKVLSLGRYSTVGRIDFINNDVMWDFIKSNKRKKFEFEGEKDVLWWSVEKTDAERLKVAKVSYLINNMKDYLADKHKISAFEAKKSRWRLRQGLHHVHH